MFFVTGNTKIWMKNAKRLINSKFWTVGVFLVSEMLIF